MDQSQNDRRCELIDKEIEGIILRSEQLELDSLQNQMLMFRREKAPLPIDELRKIYRELLEKAVEQDG